MVESFNATADDFEPLPLHKCDNCGLISAEDQLDMIRDYHDRVDAGGVAPSGECPDCGALCYPVEGGYVNGLLAIQADLVTALKDAVVRLQWHEAWIDTAEGQRILAQAAAALEKAEGR